MQSSKQHRRLGLGLALLLFAAAGCRRAVRPAPPLSDALESRRLSTLSDEYWELLMRHNPEWATFHGDRRFDAELQDLSPETRERLHDETSRLFEEVESLDPDKLAEADRITREALLSQLQGALDTWVCQQPLWDVNALDGVQAAVAELPRLHSVSTLEQGEALEVRYLKVGVLLDQHVDNLRRGMKRGFLAPRISVERVVSQLEQLLSVSPESSRFITEVRLPPDWRDEDQRALRRGLAGAVRSGTYPGLQRYLTFLETEYLPSAREEVGLSENRAGAECYEAKVRATTGLALSPEEIHRLGREQLERNLAEMRRIALQLTGEEDLAAMKRSLSESPSQRLASPAQLLEYNRLIVERARAAAGRAFRKLPSQPLEVVPIDDAHAKGSPPGYYYQGSLADRRPGTYYLNTHDAPNRLLFQMEPLAFHETVPGHHLQIALAQELRGLPRFRQELGAPIFKEGWAHYAELLADELELYSSPEARFGMLSDQALRAARLVVDTGLHALGWTRDEAIAFLAENTAEPMDSIAREVDRYIAWPAQALGYKLGQLEILRLRAEAQERLGERFDLKAFHDRLLANGAVPLPVLRRVMSQWVGEAARAGTSAPLLRGAAHR